MIYAKIYAAVKNRDFFINEVIRADYFSSINKFLFGSEDGWSKPRGRFELASL